MVEQDSRRFEGRVAIITGAAGDIGSATARQFAREGARIVLTDLAAAADKGTALAQTCKAEGAPDAFFVPCDVTLEGDVAKVVESAMARFQRVDVMVNVAGHMIFKPVKDLTAKEWRQQMDVNFMGAVYFTHVVLNVMRQGSTIVNVSSIHAFQTSPLVAPYAAAKAALLSLTRSTAIEGHGLGIRANAVAPGAIDTPMFRGNPNVASGAEQIPPNMLGRPEDIASVIAFLASNDAQFITGSVVTADGGRMAIL